MAQENRTGVPTTQGAELPAPAESSEAATANTQDVVSIVHSSLEQDDGATTPKSEFSDSSSSDESDSKDSNSKVNSNREQHARLLERLRKDDKINKSRLFSLETDTEPRTKRKVPRRLKAIKQVNYEPEKRSPLKQVQLPGDIATPVETEEDEEPIDQGFFSDFDDDFTSNEITSRDIKETVQLIQDQKDPKAASYLKKARRNSLTLRSDRYTYHDLALVENAPAEDWHRVFEEMTKIMTKDAIHMYCKDKPVNLSAKWEKMQSMAAGKNIGTTDLIQMPIRIAGQEYRKLMDRTKQDKNELREGICRLEKEKTELATSLEDSGDTYEAQIAELKANHQAVKAQLAQAQAKADEKTKALEEANKEKLTWVTDGYKRKVEHHGLRAEERLAKAEEKVSKAEERASKAEIRILKAEQARDNFENLLKKEKEARKDDQKCSQENAAALETELLDIRQARDALEVLLKKEADERKEAQEQQQTTYGEATTVITGRTDEADEVILALIKERDNLASKLAEEKVSREYFEHQVGTNFQMLEESNAAVKEKLEATIEELGQQIMMLEPAQAKFDRLSAAIPKWQAESDAKLKAAHDEVDNIKAKLKAIEKATVRDLRIKESIDRLQNPNADWESVWVEKWLRNWPPSEKFQFQTAPMTRARQAELVQINAYIDAENREAHARIDREMEERRTAREKREKEWEKEFGYRRARKEMRPEAANMFFGV